MPPRYFLAALCGLLLSGSVSAAPSLKEVFSGKFRVGAAVREIPREEADPAAARLLAEQFDSITPENLLKWSRVHPAPERYSFEAADRYVAFGEKRGMKIIGHTLVWHQQTPEWVFRAGATGGGEGAKIGREALLARLCEHIRTVVGRYKGRIHGWDVVNEVISDSGALRRSPWLEILGEDYIATAFACAHEADPKAELYYNDYGLEAPAKRRGALALVKKLLAAGVPISGVGLQGHYSLRHPEVARVEETIRDFAALGVKVMITELDVNVLPNPHGDIGADVSVRYAADPKWNPYREGLPDAVQQELTLRYEALFAVFLRNARSIDRVTFWGTHDGASWLNGWPIRGRTNHPLLFDRTGQPKPAFHRVIQMNTYTNPVGSSPIHMGDPFVFRHDGKYYLIGTTDANEGFRCYESDDLANWRMKGWAYRKTPDCWATGAFWAPEVLHYGGKFYLTYSGIVRGSKPVRLQMALAVSDRPEGPYRDLYAPWFDPGYSTIDGHLFVDDDGTPYLYFSRNTSRPDFCSGENYGVRLERDLSKPIGEPALLLEAGQSWERVNWDQNRCNEGATVVKHGGRYYMTYSANHTGFVHYGVGYATAEHPLGPWTKALENPILASNLAIGVSAPGHNSLVRSPDGKEWFIVYHAHADPKKPSFDRVVYIDRIEFTPDGKLRVLGPTRTPQPLPR